MKRDLTILAGIILIGIGLWMIVPWSMFIGVGLLFIFIGFVKKDK